MVNPDGVEQRLELAVNSLLFDAVEIAVFLESQVFFVSSFLNHERGQANCPLLEIYIEREIHKMSKVTSQLSKVNFFGYSKCKHIFIHTTRKLGLLSLKKSNGRSEFWPKSSIDSHGRWGWLVSWWHTKYIVNHTTVSAERRCWELSCRRKKTESPPTLS